MDKKDDANLKIADFGFAKKHDSATNVLRAQCGTPGCAQRTLFVTTRPIFRYSRCVAVRFFCCPVFLCGGFFCFFVAKGGAASGRSGVGFCFGAKRRRLSEGLVALSWRRRLGLAITIIVIYYFWLCYYCVAGCRLIAQGNS